MALAQFLPRFDTPDLRRCRRPQERGGISRRCDARHLSPLNTHERWWTRRVCRRERCVWYARASGMSDDDRVSRFWTVDAGAGTKMRQVNSMDSHATDAPHNTPTIITTVQHSVQRRRQHRSRCYYRTKQLIRIDWLRYYYGIRSDEADWTGRVIISYYYSLRHLWLKSSNRTGRFVNFAENIKFVNLFSWN